MEYALQFITGLLNAFILVTIIVYVSRRRLYPRWLLVAILVLISLCVADALIRQSWWPVFTAVTAAIVGYIVYSTRERQIITEMKKRRDEVRERIRQEEIMHDHYEGDD